LNELYPILIGLSVLIFLDPKFYRVLIYSTLFNFVVALISLQAKPFSGAVLFIFGCVFFPLIAWFAIESCEKEERERIWHLVLIAAITIPALFIFFSSFQMSLDHVMLFMLFAFSLLAILSARNLLKFLFIFDIAENSLILLAYSFFPANVFTNISTVVFIEIATFLPFVLLTYLTVHIFKKYRSLNPWHLWHSP